ncbi:retron St85 family RNA-directed DNA polymerase [Cereibacter sphaeroides]|uniref:retron St85 family RNA-directed DNA polymerase n=1 Tax=Cereibacter sphaeroides TaxID=1063 RepID=UPI000F526F2E|nr:retron St85 family RNA-directed DNA polymerase [Cereibacter sphaeroides]AZB70275.1 RNA-directed DNA polymerase [Cereibacter sphaeroides]
MLREVLAAKSGMSLSRIERLQCNASKMYKTYPIPKRDGSDRMISQPTPELKAVQRWLARGIFQRLPVSACATAYKKGASIRKNAEAHVASSFTIHLDFKDFFPSFSHGHVSRFLSEATRLSQEDILFCSDIVSRHGCLTIGAPSSPSVTNALMYSFDVSVERWCMKRGLIYTRYADDINISSKCPGALREVEDFVRDASGAFEYANLVINERKTAYLSRKYRRSITGVNVTPEGRLSIGRDRKREIKSLVHQCVMGTLQVDMLWRLGGLIAFSSDVEPHFVDALKNKYGADVIEKILHQKTPRGAWVAD